METKVRKMPNWSIHSLDVLSDREWEIYLCIIAKCGLKRYCKMSTRKISRIVRCNKDVATRGLLSLKGLGLIGSILYLGKTVYVINKSCFKLGRDGHGFGKAWTVPSLVAESMARYEEEKVRIRGERSFVSIGGRIPIPPKLRMPYLLDSVGVRIPVDFITVKSSIGFGPRRSSRIRRLYMAVQILCLPLGEWSGKIGDLAELLKLSRDSLGEMLDILDECNFIERRYVVEDKSTVKLRYRRVDGKVVAIRERQFHSGRRVVGIHIRLLDVGVLRIGDVVGVLWNGRRVAFYAKIRRSD